LANIVAFFSQSV